jgi:hypothetical protein
MGDYDQVVASATGYCMTWGDNRLTDAAHKHQPDVRFAQVDNDKDDKDRDRHGCRMTKKLDRTNE